MAGKKNGANKAVKTKRVKAKTNWILCIAVIALVIYVAVRIVDQNVRIQKAKEELSELDNYKTLQDIRMEELKHFADAAENNDLDLLSDYIEKIARENLKIFLICTKFYTKSDNLFSDVFINKKPPI